MPRSTSWVEPHDSDQRYGRPKRPREQRLHDGGAEVAVLIRHEPS